MTRLHIRRWVATADARPARWVRSLHRAALRLRAKLRSGSVSAEMDRVVATARDDTVGSGLQASVAPRARAARRRRRNG